MPKDKKKVSQLLDHDAWKRLKVIQAENEIKSISKTIIAVLDRLDELEDAVNKAGLDVC
jgi:hypothetical protein